MYSLSITPTTFFPSRGNDGQAMRALGLHSQHIHRFFLSFSSTLSRVCVEIPLVDALIKLSSCLRVVLKYESHCDVVKCSGRDNNIQSCAESIMSFKLGRLTLLITN